MHRDSLKFIILGLQKFEIYTLHIYTTFTLKLIFHHLIMKSNVQHNNIMSLQLLY